MIYECEQLKTEVLQALSCAKDVSDVESLRVKMLGRKGKMTEVLKSLGSLPPEERKEIGMKANRVRDEVQKAIEEARLRLEAENLNMSLIAEKLDVTMPGTKKPAGGLHPITKTFDKLEGLFINLGFDVAEGYHIETEYYNFDALNTPKTHPSRDPQDTFYFGNGFLLRTHTSPAQVRTMESRKPPIRIVAPGMTFRRDEIDATHTPAFHQMEGLVIDRGITFGDLKGCLEIVGRYIFGEGTKIRLRPSFFPFTEPSAEVDISCYACVKGGNAAKPDCRICKGSGWVELLGCGMVHPRVLEMSGIDSNEYAGYAFGLGIDRITSAIHGVSDPRLYFENDVGFLGAFPK